MHIKLITDIKKVYINDKYDENIIKRSEWRRQQILVDIKTNIKFVINQSIEESIKFSKECLKYAQIKIKPECS